MLKDWPRGPGWSNSGGAASKKLTDRQIVGIGQWLSIAFKHDGEGLGKGTAEVKR